MHFNGLSNRGPFRNLLYFGLCAECADKILEHSHTGGNKTITIVMSSDIIPFTYFCNNHRFIYNRRNDLLSLKSLCMTVFEILIHCLLNIQTKWVTFAVIVEKVSKMSLT